MDMLPYSVAGSGSPTLIFLHYFGGSCREWRAVILDLQRHFECVAADAPGFGEASGLTGFTVEEMTQQVLELVQSFAPRPCVLVGHSMMGKVSMVAASRSPANLRGLVLAAPSPLEPEPMTEEARSAMVLGNRNEEAARAFFTHGLKSPLNDADIAQGTEDALRADPAAWRSWPQSGSREDWSAAIPPLELPTLLLVGEHDPAIPLAFQKEKTLPHLRNGRLMVIPKVGHLLPYEAPTIVAGQIADFARGLPDS